MSNFGNVDSDGGFALAGGDWNDLLDEANATGENVGVDDTASFFDGVDTDMEVEGAAPSRAIPQHQPSTPPTPAPQEDHRAPEVEEVVFEAPEVEVKPEVFDAPTFEAPAFDAEVFEASEENVADEAQVETPGEEGVEGEGTDAFEPVHDPFSAPTDPFATPQESFEGSSEGSQEAPVVQEVQATTPSAPVEPVHQVSAPRIKVPTLADDLTKVHQVISILDAYRALGGDERTVAAQFINDGEIIEDEGEFVVKVLNVDPMLSITMRALQESKKLDDVERSFFIIELEDDVLYSLGSLVSVFLEEDDDMDRAMGRGKYARSLVRHIAALDAKAMNFVTATESVLAASERK